MSDAVTVTREGEDPNATKRTRNMGRLAWYVEYEKGESDKRDLVLSRVLNQPEGGFADTKAAMTWLDHDLSTLEGDGDGTYHLVREVATVVAKTETIVKRTLTERT